MVLMVIGSTLAAAAQTWGMLLLGRALQGMSAAGIMSTITIVLSDKVSLRENAKNNTIFQFVSATAYAYGPVVGGYLTNANWRWCFVLSIPIALIGNVLIFVLLRKELVHGTHSVRRSFFSGFNTLDLGGTIIFVAAITLIILATAWGGSSYSWSSAHVVAPLTIGAVLFVIFPVYEYFMEPGRYLSLKFPTQVAIIPYSLFKRKDILLVTYIQFGAGMALYSVFYFSSIYFILVEGYGAGKAGTQLLYYIPGIGVGVYMAMFMCNVYPASTFPPLMLGTVIETIGIGMIAYAAGTREVAVLCGMLGFCGVGTGMRFMPSNLHITGIWPTKREAGLSLMRFALPFGGTLAFTIMGAVYNNKMAVTSSFVDTSGLGESGFGGGNSASVTAINKLPPQQRELLRETAKNAVRWAYISILPMLGLSVVAALFLGNVWIKTRSDKPAAKEMSHTAQPTIPTQGHTQPRQQAAPPAAAATPTTTKSIRKGKYEPYIVYGPRWLIFKLVQTLTPKKPDSTATHSAVDPLETRNENYAQEDTTAGIDVEKVEKPYDSVAQETAPASYVLLEIYVLALLRGRKYVESRRETWSLD